jgi:N-acetylglucosaminyldiphosphoundecaprenol N-acetyl-beta-D-mannosaminyltransferase
MVMQNLASCNILGMQVNTINMEQVQEIVTRWVEGDESRSIALANVHMVMESYDCPSFRNIINSSDLTIPDGKPLSFFMFVRQLRKQPQIRGPELALRLCSMAQDKFFKVGFYGSTPLTLEKLTNSMHRMFPSLDIAYIYSPPFRSLTSEEDDQVIKEINDSGTRILFVGLGCPKQERWMWEHIGKINSVMVGVGQAFDIHAGILAEAPAWLRSLGLEWFFRFLNEPKRLWKRYVKNNPRFLLLATLQLLRVKKF